MVLRLPPLPRQQLQPCALLDRYAIIPPKVKMILVTEL